MSGIAEVFLTDSEADCVRAECARFGSLPAIEKTVLRPEAQRSCFFGALADFSHRVALQWRDLDHAVIRNVPSCSDGMTGLLLAAACFSALKPYRGGQIVKHFRMSPWTTALSHTLASGFFHTDINTAPLPPAATVMQCLERDPGTPAFGQLRVARVADLLQMLAASGRSEALQFLTRDRITMVNETSPEGWSGILVDGNTIRFHPESLQAASNRGFPNPAGLQGYLDAVHEAALAVSVPIDLAPGELLFVSNRRALHQRGACTVRFYEYPRRFDARRVSVFHALDEPT